MAPPALKRALTPSLNSTGLGSSAAAIYATVVMIWNATRHHAVIDPQVIVAALGAAAFLYARFKVTPVADPKDGNGQPLKVALPVVFAAGGGGAASLPNLGGGGSGGFVPGVPLPPQKTLLPPVAAAAEQPPAAAGPAEPAATE